MALVAFSRMRLHIDAYCALWQTLIFITVRVWLTAGRRCRSMNLADWADVFVPNLSERLKLERSALFYIPMALERCSEAGLTVSSLATFASVHAVGRTGPWAGRSAITKVLGLKPVVHESTLGFIQVAAAAFAARQMPPPFKTTDIVACVFRLKDPSDVVRGLETSIDDIARACDLSRELVAAALQRYRLQYVDAAAIWNHLRELRRTRASAPPEVDAVLTANPMDFIKTDVRQNLPLAIRRQDDDDYVYGWQNLRPAPRTGHPWAVES